jgi:hypothetical protein
VRSESSRQHIFWLSLITGGTLFFCGFNLFQAKSSQGWGVVSIAASFFILGSLMGFSVAKKFMPARSLRKERSFGPSSVEEDAYGPNE